MKIISFVASPNKAGNTARAVNKILEGAKETGAETEAFYCGDLDIKPCQGCFACKNDKKAECVIADDMQKIFVALKDADVLVFGSPLYMGQMSGQAKIFVDRLSSQFMPRFSPFYKEQPLKKLIVVFTQGNPDTSMFQPYYDYIKSIFNMVGFDTELHIAADMRSGQANDKEEPHSCLRQVGASLTEKQPQERILK